MLKSMDNGFTLIEMLFSILIISIIATILSINLSDQVKTSQLDSATKQIQALIEGSRSCALATSDDSQLIFGQDTAQTNCNGKTTTQKFRDITITTNLNGNTIRFTAKGIVVQAGTIEVCNEDLCEKITIAIGRSDAQIK